MDEVALKLLDESDVDANSDDGEDRCNDLASPGLVGSYTDNHLKCYPYP